MNRQMNPEIAAKILRLPNKDVVKYLIGGMNHIGKDIKTVRQEIKNDTVLATGSVPRGRGGASYSTYFGLGDESTNPGISDKLRVAIDGVAIQGFMYIAPETTFGFEAIVALASSARQAVTEEAPTVEIKKKKTTTTKKKKAQTKSSKSPSSALPPSVMPSSKRMRSNTLHHSSSDMEYAVGSEMGNQKMPHRPPQQADAQVHGSGGDGSDSAQAKSSNDLCSDTSGEENNSNNNLNSSGGKMPSAFQSGFGMATLQYPQQLQDFSIPNNTGSTEGAQNLQMMPWQMMMMNQQMMTGNYNQQDANAQSNQGIQPQYGIPTPQGFMMVPMVPMMMPPVGGIGTASAQEGSATDSSLKTDKTSTSDTTHVANNSTQAVNKVAPAPGPSNDSATREEAEDGESPESKSKDALEVEKTAAQEYSRGDDDLDYAITTHTCTDSGSLPSIWLETKSLKKAIENGTFIDLPNEMKVRVLKYVGAGCHGSVWNVHLYIGSSSKPIECVVKVQYPSKSLNSEYTVHLKLAHRVGQSPAGQEYPFPVSHKLITYCNEEGKGTGGGLFFMSAEEGCNLHTLATEKSPIMGTIVRLADSMLTILETLHVKGKLLVRLAVVR